MVFTKGRELVEVEVVVQEAEVEGDTGCYLVFLVRRFWQAICRQIKTYMDV